MHSGVRLKSALVSLGRPGLVLLSLFSIQCVSLGAAKDVKSGGDHVRGRAKEISLGQTHDDHVSTETGDHTDWKMFSVLEPTRVTIDLYWDNPSIKSKVYIKDQFGGVVFELPHRTGQRKDHWADIKLREGEYYLQVEAKRGNSVYTIEITPEGSFSGRGGSRRSITRPE